MNHELIFQAVAELEEEEDREHDQDDNEQQDAI